MTASVFTLSIETTIHPAFQAPYHVGTDERIARQCAEETFQNRKWFADYGHVTIRTVALMREGRVFDVFDGQWQSDLYEADMAEAEARSLSTVEAVVGPLAVLQTSTLRQLLVSFRAEGDAVAVRLIEAELEGRELGEPAEPAKPARITSMTDLELRDAWGEAQATADVDRADAIWAVFVSRHGNGQPIKCEPEYYGGWYALRGDYDLDVRVAHGDSEVNAILWLLDLEADADLASVNHFLGAPGGDDDDGGMAEERARHP